MLRSFNLLVGPNANRRDGREFESKSCVRHMFATVAESLKGDFALRLVFLWAHPFRTRIRTQQPCPQWFRADLGTGRPGLQVSEITEICNDNQRAATRKRLTSDCVLVHGGFESFRCNGIC